MPGPHKHSAQSAIKYLENKNPHSINSLVKERNERVSSNCLDVSDAMKQQTKLLKRLGKIRSDSIALYSIVQSFDPDELDYHHVSDIDKCHQIGIDVAKQLTKAYPDRIWAVFTQADGEAHHLHNHILFFNYDRSLHALGHSLSWQRDLKPINEWVTRKHLQSQPAIDARYKDWQGGNEPLRIRYHKRHINRKRNISHIKKSVQQALLKAQSRNEFTKFLELQNVKILARSNNNDPWFTTTGQYRKALTFQYHGFRARSNTVLGLTVMDIDDQLSINAKKVNATDHLNSHQENINNTQHHHTIIKRNISTIKPGSLIKGPNTQNKVNNQTDQTNQMLSQDDYINLLRKKQRKLQQTLQLAKTEQRRFTIQQKLNQVTYDLNQAISQQMVSATNRATWEMNHKDDYEFE